MAKPEVESIIVSSRAKNLSFTSYVLIIIGLALSIIYTGLYGVDNIFSYVGTGFLAIGSSISIVLMIVKNIVLSTTASIVKNTKWRRIVVNEVSENELVNVRITCSLEETENIGHNPLVFLKIIDNPPELFRVKGSTELVTSVDQLGNTVLSYTLSPVLGTHYFSSINLFVEDLFGLFKASIIVPEINSIRVLPKILIDPREIILNLESVVPGGTTLTRKPGPGLEYLFTREYQYGDDYRYIDWKAYARTRKLMVKVFEKEASLILLFYIIITPSLYHGVKEVTPIEFISRIITTLANYLAFRGDVFALGYIVSSSSAIKYFTGYSRGYKHVYVFRRILAEIPWYGEFYFKDTSDEVIEELHRRVKREKTVIILATDFNKDLLFADILANKLFDLKKLGHEIYIIIPDPLLFEEKAIERMLRESSRYRKYIDLFKKLSFIEHSRLSSIYADIYKRLMEKGYYVIRSSPEETVLNIIHRIEYLRRYYG